jgi:hypothetical protein
MLMNAGVNNMQQMASSSSSKWTDAVGEIAKTVSAYDDISKRFNDVMTMIDCECLKGNELDLFTCAPSSTEARQDKPRDKRHHPRREPRRSRSVDDVKERGLFKQSKKAKDSEVKKHHPGEKKTSGKASKEKLADNDKVQPVDVAASVVAGTYFSKVDCYANARLPSDLPPLAL